MRFLLHIAVFVLAFLPAAAIASGVEGFVKAELSAMLPWDRADIEIDEVEVPGLKAPEGAALRLEVPGRLLGPGKVSFRLEVSGNGAPAKAWWGSARVRVFRDAVVALRPLKSRTPISADAVKVARVELGDAVESFSSVGELEGMVAKRPISAGAVVKKSYVKREVIVKRGELVSVSVEGPSIRIRSTGTAEEDGHMGSVITVKTASGREIAGEVTAPGEILISF